MRTVTQVFAAGESHRWQIVGSYFRLMEITYPEVADIKILRMGATKTEAQQVDAGYSYKSPENFDGIEITCTNPCTVKFAVSDGSGTYDRTVGSVAISGGVNITGGSVDVVKGKMLNMLAPVSVGTSLVTGCSALNGTKSVYFRASEANSAEICIGASGVTTANAVIRLKPGDFYVDEISAEAGWYAISSAAGQILQVMRGS